MSHALWNLGEKLMSAVSQLYRLQLVDSEWDEKDDQLAETMRSLGPSQDVLRAQEAVEQNVEEMHQLRLRLRELQDKAAALDAKLKANQERLYGVGSRSAKELRGLEEEAKSLRHLRSELDESQLEIMFAVEAGEAEGAERRARLSEIEAAWAEEQAILQAERQRLELRLAELRELRAEMRARISKADLALYEELRSTLGGTAVALLKRGMCQVCGVDVPTGMAQAVARGEGSHYCPVCNRLLYSEG